MDKETQKLIYFLLQSWSRSLKISSKQKMKLSEWIIPNLMSELKLKTDIMNIKDIRKYIDSWESKDLNEDEYKYYYVDKNSNGKSFWDFI